MLRPRVGHNGTTFIKVTGRESHPSEDTDDRLPYSPIGDGTETDEHKFGSIAKAFTPHNGPKKKHRRLCSWQSLTVFLVLISFGLAIILNLPFPSTGSNRVETLDHSRPDFGNTHFPNPPPTHTRLAAKQIRIMNLTVSALAPTQSTADNPALSTWDGSQETSVNYAGKLGEDIFNARSAQWRRAR